MISKAIFKAYDVRGLYPQDVNADSITIIGKALAYLWQSGTVVIAHDGRHGAVELAHAMEKSIVEYGKSIGKTYTTTFVGLSTTPMFYFLVNDLNACGGAMITASHNPKEYNGVKAVLPKALPVSGVDLLKVITEQKLS